MQEFKDIVKKIFESPPTYGFGFKHYNNGLNSEYNGPKYGKFTIADAYFAAGIKQRKINSEK